MDDAGVSIQVSFSATKKGSTRGCVVIRDKDHVIHSDQIDIAKAPDRDRLVKDLGKKCPGVDGDEVHALLLEEVGRRSEVCDTEPAMPCDLDVSRIVRPHLFFTDVVGGLLIPGVRIIDGRPSGHWSLYLQWADGKRECRDLERSLGLPGGQTLWFSRVPGDPDVIEVCGWSKDSRRKWLDGYMPQAGEVFRELATAFSHFLEFPREEAKGHLAVLSLWTVLSYVYPVWPAVPYLSIGGPLGSGKSRVFDVLVRLVHRAIVSSNMTAPCLFRTLDMRGGTLLLYEAERLMDQGPEVAELRSILLAGYKAGQKAQRLEKIGDSFRPVDFDVYGPKAVACIGELPAALASRCIRIGMFRASRASEKPSRQLASYGRWDAIRDDLHCLALGQGQVFRVAAAKVISCEGLYGRDIEIWSPILGLAEFFEKEGAEGLVPLVQDHARQMVARQRDDGVSGVDEVVLQALVSKLEGESCGATAAQILGVAREEEPSLFQRYSARGIGAILKRYGMHSTRAGGKRYFRPSDTQLRSIQDT